MPEKRLVIIGAGGHGQAVAEAAMLMGLWESIQFLDDAFPGASSSGPWNIIGNTAQLATVLNADDSVIVAIGNQQVRAKLLLQLQQLSAKLVTIQHSRAWVSNTASIGAGCAIMAGAIVGTNAVLGQGVIVNANATVDHDCQLGDYAHLGVGVQLAGGVVISERSWLQAGTCAGYRVVVPPNSIIAPGTALIAD